MNILVKAIQDVMWVIPEEVLKETFMPKYNNWRAPASSMEEQILALVVRPRVIPDASIAKGEHMTISLTGITPKFLDDFRCVYEIPEHRLQGRSLVSVIDVVFTPYNGGGGIGALGYAMGGTAPMYSQDVMTATQQMVEASSAIPNVGSARVELIAENTILVEDYQRFSPAYFVNCFVTDNNYMNKIDPRYFEYFSQLVEYAVKAYIYRKLRIRIDKGQVEGGSTIGEFKAVVDEYSDAETNYRTYLKTIFAKAMFMSDRSRYRRLINSKIPIGL